MSDLAVASYQRQGNHGSGQASDQASVTQADTTPTPIPVPLVGSNQQVLTPSSDTSVDQTPWHLVIATVLFVCLAIIVLYYLHGKYQDMTKLIQYAESMRKLLREQETQQSSKVTKRSMDNNDADDEEEQEDNNGEQNMDSNKTIQQAVSYIGATTA